MSAAASADAVRASSTLLPCYLDPFQDCSDEVNSVTNNIILVAVALGIASFGLVTLATVVMG